MTSDLKEKERFDDLQINGLEIIQNPDYFCFGIDAVLLAHFAKAADGQRVLDLCSGNGIVPLLMTAHSQAEHITGLEIQEYNVDMALRSVTHNGLENRVSMICGDVKDASKTFGASSFHVVTVNPPYMMADTGLRNEASQRAIARHEVLCSLEDVVREAAKVLMPKGRFYMVHRPARLADIMTIMRQHRLEPKRMRLVYPYVNKEPNLVLIEGLKDGRPNLVLEKPLIVYDENGSYTDEIYDIYGWPKKEE